MKKDEFESGDQVRELCSDFNGRRFFNRYGYVVEHIDERTLAILWTHDALRIRMPGSSRMDVTDVQKTGKRYVSKSGGQPG
jgi:hypothetical protein